MCRGSSVTAQVEEGVSRRDCKIYCACQSARLKDSLCALYDLVAFCRHAVVSVIFVENCLLFITA